MCSFQKLTGTGPTWPLQATPTHVATQPAGRSPTSRFREISWGRNYKRKETFLFSIVKNQAQKRKKTEMLLLKKERMGDIFLWYSRGRQISDVVATATTSMRHVLYPLMKYSHLILDKPFVFPGK